METNLVYGYSLKILANVMAALVAFWFLLALMFYQRGNAQAFQVCIAIALILAAGSLLVRVIRMRVGEPFMKASKGKKLCKYCGTENDDDAIFCKKCGKKLTK